MKILYKSVFLSIILIAGLLILDGFQNILFGLNIGYFEIALGSIIITFVFVYFKFIEWLLEIFNN